MAVLCVVASHDLGVYWNSREEVAAAIMARPPAAPSPAITEWIASRWFNPGPFGVAIFFLISGFVVPFSLGRLSRARFLAARAWRIYPTYAVGLAVGLAMLAVLSAWSGEAFTISGLRVLANLLLIHGHLGQRSIDMVNWTLAIEVEFYVVMAFIGRLMSRPGVMAAVGAGLSGMGLLALIALPGGLLGAEARSFYGLSFLPYMMIGTLFWQHWCGNRSWARLILAGSTLFGAFAAGVAFGPLNNLALTLLPAYVQALVVFAGAYALRGAARPNRLIDGLASISYPLYVVHTLLGYGVMTAILATDASPAIAILGAMLIVVCVAITLHVTVEGWSIAVGRRAAWPVRSTARAVPAPRP